MKYFFLSQGWQVRRVWGTAGLWNEVAWRRKPQIVKMGIYLVDDAEEMVLYKVEDAVEIVEVIPEQLPIPTTTDQTISQVRITRLVSAEQALERITAIDKLSS